MEKTDIIREIKSYLPKAKRLKFKTYYLKLWCKISVKSHFEDYRLNVYLLFMRLNIYNLQGHSSLTPIYLTFIK